MRILMVFIAVMIYCVLMTGVAMGEPEKGSFWEGKEAIFDAHCDTALRILDEGLDLSIRGQRGNIDIPRLRDGGVAVQVFALWPSPSFRPDHVAHQTLCLLEAVLQALDRNNDSLAVAHTVREAREINSSGRMAVFLAIEGGEAIEQDLGLLRLYHRLGVRSMTITWMNNTAWADSSGDKPRLKGLSPFGVKVIKEMNRLGMVIDLSHVSQDTARDILKVTSRPVIASHSCCYAINDHFRNLTDDELRALAGNNGVIGINFAPDFLDHQYRDAVEKIRNELKPQIEALEKECAGDRKLLQKKKRALYAEKMKGLPEVPIDRLIDHIDHAVKIAGIDHVGLGSDFDGIGATPKGLEDCSKLQAIAAKMSQRGYSKKDIQKIMMGNFMRVYQEVIGE
jgi:membrane dipeptidase